LIQAGLPNGFIASVNLISTHEPELLNSFAKDSKEIGIEIRFRNKKDGK
jgi:hypothetical protein